MTCAICPQCGGQPDLDEQGRPYTCYFCCDTGLVDQAVASAYDQELVDEREQFRPRRLGVYLPPMAHEYDWDEFEPAPGSRLFTRMVRCSAPAPAPFAIAIDDDLPF